MTYRKLFRYAELRNVTALTARHTFVDRGLLLGISEHSTVHRRFPRPAPALDELTRKRAQCGPDPDEAAGRVALRMVHQSRL